MYLRVDSSTRGWNDQDAQHTAAELYGSRTTGSHVMVSIFLDEKIGAQGKNPVHGIIDDGERFWDIFNVEGPHNTAGTSVLLSISNAAVETTIVGDQNSNQK